MSRSYPNLNDDKGHYVDRFPHLGEVLLHGKKQGKYDMPLTPIHFGIGTTGKIGSIVANIQEENGPFAIKNHRIVEWVVMQMLTAILEQKKAEGLVDYSLWLSYFEADLRHHVDVFMSAKTQRGTSYFTIDLTLGVQKVVEKIFAHARWNNERPNFLIGNHALTLPHLIIYTDPLPSEGITANIDRACRIGSFRNRGEIQAALKAYVAALPAPPLGEILIATPDRSNLSIQTPHHREIISDFTGQLGAKKFDQTTLQEK